MSALVGFSDVLVKYGATVELHAQQRVEHSNVC